MTEALGARYPRGCVPGPQSEYTVNELLREDKDEISVMVASCPHCLTIQINGYAMMTAP